MSAVSRLRNPYLPPTHPENAGTMRVAPSRDRRPPQDAAVQALREALALCREYEAAYKAALDAADPTDPEEVLKRILELLERLAESSYSLNVSIAAQRQHAQLAHEEEHRAPAPDIDDSAFDATATFSQQFRAAFLLAKWHLRSAPPACLVQLFYDLVFGRFENPLRREVFRQISDAVRHGVVWMHNRNNEDGSCWTCGQPGVSFKERLEHRARFERQAAKRRKADKTWRGKR